MLYDKKFRSDILFTIIIGGIISFFNYLFNVLLAQQLPDKDFGIYSAGLGVITLIAFTTITVQSHITKIVAKNRTVGLGEYRKKNLLVFLLIGVGGAAIFLSLSPIISSRVGVPEKFIPYIALAFVVFTVAPVIKGFLYGLQYIKFASLITLFETIIKFALGLMALRYFTNATLPILAHSIPVVISTILVILWLKSKDKKKSVAVDLELSELWWIFATYLLINAPFTFDLLLVNPEIRPSYSALAMLGKVVYIASTLISSVMVANVAKEVSRAARRRVLTVFLVASVLIGGFLTAAYYLFDEMIVEFVFQGKYLEITPFVAIFGMGMTIYSVVFMTVNYLIVNDRKYQIFSLLMVFILQLTLFQLYNETLQDAVRNQIIVYIVLGISFIPKLIFQETRNAKAKT